MSTAPVTAGLCRRGGRPVNQPLIDRNTPSRESCILNGHINPPLGITGGVQQGGAAVGTLAPPPHVARDAFRRLVI